ncbi:MAG: LamG domain-containing protein, partial [Bacteroidales bacterium]|nr:LamG domain-containing protein [Bacteroidales bacterium]
MKKISFILINLIFIVLTVRAQQEVNALHFDGNDDYVSLGTSSILKPSDALSFEAHINPATWAVSDTVYIIASSATQGYYMIIRNGILEAGVFRNGAFMRATFSVSTMTGWHHVAFVYNGRYLYLYFDGTLRRTVDGTTNYPITYGTGSVV